MTDSIKRLARLHLFLDDDDDDDDHRRGCGCSPMHTQVNPDEERPILEAIGELIVTFWIEHEAAGEEDPNDPRSLRGQMQAAGAAWEEAAGLAFQFITCRRDRDGG